MKRRNDLEDTRNKCDDSFHSLHEQYLSTNVKLNAREIQLFVLFEHSHRKMMTGYLKSPIDLSIVKKLWLKVPFTVIYNFEIKNMHKDTFRKASQKFQDKTQYPLLFCSVVCKYNPARKSIELLALGTVYQVYQKKRTTIKIHL